MKVRIIWLPVGQPWRSSKVYDDMDDVSLKIHNLIMQRIAFSVEFL